MCNDFESEIGKSGSNSVGVRYIHFYTDILLQTYDSLSSSQIWVWANWSL